MTINATNTTSDILPEPIYRRGTLHANDRNCYSCSGRFALGSTAGGSERYSALGSHCGPPELSGPPKKPIEVSPGLRAFAETNVIKDLNSKDPKVLSGVVRNITSFVQQYPNEPQFYFLRAGVLCLSNGDKNAVLSDVAMSLKLRLPGTTYISESPRDYYTLKAKVEFDLKRYEEAMNDVDAAIRLDFSNASQVFNDGNVKRPWYKSLSLTS